MSILVKRDSLTPAQINIIMKLLILQPVVENKRKFAQPKESIMMYLKQDEYIALPFRFALTLCKGLTITKAYRNIIMDYQPPFMVELRPYQVDPAMEARELLIKYNTVSVLLPPGWGKTVVGAWLAYLAGLVVAVIVHRDTIGDQWVTTFKKCVPALKVWVVDHTPPDFIPDVIICMDTRYSWVPEEIRSEVGTLIIDEAHVLCTRTRVPCLLHFHPKYVIVETATLHRDDGMHMMVQTIVGTHGVERISTRPHRVICIETHIAVNEVLGKQGLNFTELCKELATCEDRNTLIVNIVVNNPHRKFIILTRLAASVKILEALFKQIGIKCDTLYRSKSSYSDSQVLIGTIPKMGTGFDEANSCQDYGGVNSDTLILVHPVKKWQLYEQLRGRVMRASDPAVIWLRDINRTGRTHFQGLKAWIQKTNGSVIHYDINFGPPKL